MRLAFRAYIKLRRLVNGSFIERLPGLSSVNRILYKKIRPGEEVLLDVKGIKMYVDGRDMDITPKLLINEFGEEDYEMSLFSKSLKVGMNVVDIGAQVGLYTLNAAKKIGKKGRVYAFEPRKSNYEMLSKNIKVNGYDNVVAVEKAVSDRIGKTRLWFEKDWKGSASFSKKSVLTVSGHKKLKNGKSINVKTTSLDDFFVKVVKNKRINLIKMDAEGAEGLIIKGAEKVLKYNKRLKIFMEFWPDSLKNLGTDPLELLSKLKAYGFDIKFIDGKKRTLKPLNIKNAMTGQGFNLLLEKK